jgi:hypothetical protein
LKEFLENIPTIVHCSIARENHVGEVPDKNQVTDIVTYRIIMKGAGECN